MRFPLNLPRRLPLAGPWLMLVAVQVPVIAEAPLYVINGSLGGIPPSRYVWLAGLSAAMIFGLQLRHSLALARGERPRGGVWTLLALAALVYMPLHWLGINWFAEQNVMLASVPMVLGGWLAAVAIAGACAYIGIEWAGVFPAHPGPATGADYLYYVTYYIGTGIILPAALYASARLVRVAGELRGARIALAEAAVGRERLRVSRDLHDLLGHSMSAISLKGDLAIRLLRRDRAAALAEIENLTEVAREALAGLRAITAGGPKVTSRTNSTAPGPCWPLPAWRYASAVTSQPSRLPRARSWRGRSGKGQRTSSAMPRSPPPPPRSRTGPHPGTHRRRPAHDPGRAGRLAVPGRGHRGDRRS